MTSQALPLGPESTRTTCPQCHATVSTEITKEPSRTAYIAGGILALVGCFCGCCLIPCCMDSCKNTQHNCPQCKAFLGEYKK